ncbi:alginate export family protein [Flexithrix dorotheae]|uniref:alginate export family protein n=1 Tax=Flexithrix dorotheae TaxID=70993 RepID=UPI000360FCDF|nr:alginate export family protein [Flexithrix dorotheae]
MNTKVYNIVLISILLLIGSSSIGFAQLKVTGEIRPRTEFRNGFKRMTNASTDPVLFVEQRSRIYLDYAMDRFKFKFAIQDVRLWGNYDQIQKSDPAMTSLNFGWGEYAMTKKSFIKVGRMMLSYDNERFLGGLEWAQQGRRHDGVLYKYVNDSLGIQFHAGVTYNESSIPNTEPGKLEDTYYEKSNNKTMQFAWFHKDFGESGLSLLIHNDGREAFDSTGIKFMQTYALIGNKKLGGINLNGEFYYQGGKDALKRSVSAYFVSLNADIKAGGVPINFGVDLASGTKATETEKNNSWNPLYGTNHKFYGFMDYFYVGNDHRQGATTAGLNDIFVKSVFKTGEKSKLITHAHYFLSPVDVINPEVTSENLDKALGFEIDLVYNLQVNSFINFQLGYSQMFGTDALEAIKRVPNGGFVGDKSQINNWAWAMLTFKPVLFKN